MRANLERLESLLDSDNIADDIDEDVLTRIGVAALEEYAEDDECTERQEKRKKWEQGRKLVAQTVEAKSNLNAGMDKASNMKYPLLTVASVQFSSRAYPGIVPNQDVAKPKIYGELTDEKQQQADAVSRFINWQLFNELEEWEEDTDRLLLKLPLYGCMFRKVYYRKDMGRICTELLSPEDLVVPADTRSILDATRITERFKLAPREIVEKVRSGYYKDHDYAVDDEDAEGLEDFIQQCRWIDLDEDGFKEPYIVTVHVGSEKVARIAANYTREKIEVNSKNEVQRITPVQYYVKYTFIPSIDDNFYDLGFFDLLYPINETVNTLINQLVDAGTLANSNTGFISNDLKLRKKGPMRLQIGEFQTVNGSGDDIRKGIVHMQFKGADMVLFNLLGFVLDAGRDVAMLKEVLEGQVENNMTATTTMALIEQGLKVFSAIYKRIHRALSKELQLIRYWNYVTTNPLYDAVLDLPDGIQPEWFNDEDLNFEPVSDPAVVTDLQRAAKAQFHMQFLNDPYHDQMKLREKIYDGVNAGSFDEVKAEKAPEMQALEQQLQQAMQAVQQLQAQYQQLEADKTADKQFKQLEEQRLREIAQREAQLEQLREQRENLKTESEIEKNRAAAAKTLAEIEALGKESKQMTEQADALHEEFVYMPGRGVVASR